MTPAQVADWLEARAASYRMSAARLTPDIDEHGYEIYTGIAEELEHQARTLRKTGVMDVRGTSQEQLTIGEVAP